MDAYLGDDGKIQGEITANTRYLVSGDSPESGSRAALQAGTNDMYKTASSLGVETITLPEFLSQMGYRPQDRTVQLAQTRRRVISQRDQKAMHPGRLDSEPARRPRLRQRRQRIGNSERRRLQSKLNRKVRGAVVGTSTLNRLVRSAAWPCRNIRVRQKWPRRCLRRWQRPIF